MALSNRVRSVWTLSLRCSLPYLAVPAVLDERSACSIVPGRALCVPGRTKPLRGRPDCDIGLANIIRVHYHHLVTRLMTVTDLLQVVPTRLIQAVRNKLLRACCHQLVNNLLRADDIRLAGTTCCESVGLINLVTR